MPTPTITSPTPTRNTEEPASSLDIVSMATVDTITDAVIV